MKKLLITTLFVFISLWAVSQTQACYDSIMQVKGKWTKHEDALMSPDKNIAQIKIRIDSISQLFRQAYPDPRGMEPSWYRTMANQPANSPIAYAFNSLYFSYYCNQNLKKMMRGDETGTWAYVFVNYLSWFMSRQYDLLLIKVNKNEVYILPPKRGDWKGYTVYESSSHREKAACIVLLRPGDKLPWKYITQEQYLKALKEFWEAKKKESIESYAKMDSGHQKSVESIQRNNHLKPEDKEKIVDGLNKQHAKQLSTREADLARVNKYWDEKIIVIDNYFQSNDAATLKLPANLDKHIMGDFKGQFSNEQKGGQYPVLFNPAYFDPQLPKYMPQFMVLYWIWEKNAPSQDFKKQFEQNFPVEKLQAMMGKLSPSN